MAAVLLFATRGHEAADKPEAGNGVSIRAKFKRLEQNISATSLFYMTCGC